MKPSEIEAYLHTHIPLSQAMGVRVLEAGDASILLEAPLEPNINHRSTIFGGSLTTLGILSAWTWLHCFTRSRGLSPALVIQSESMQFDAPATGIFRAQCNGTLLQKQSIFLSTLKRYKRARIELTSILTVGEAQVGRFLGSFVALNAPTPVFDPN